LTWRSVVGLGRSCRSGRNVEELIDETDLACHRGLAEDAMAASNHAHGYTFVIERGSIENPVVWYVANTADITTTIVQAYNAMSGISL
jgi:hypothetical protein